MKQIGKIDFVHLHHNEHVEYNTACLEVFTQEMAAAIGVGPLRTAWANALANEKAIFNPVRGYVLTPEVQEKDRLRDMRLLFVFQTIDANEYAYDPAKVAAATYLVRITKQYRHANTKPYFPSISDVTSMADALQTSVNAPYVATLGLTEAVALMRTANEDFFEAYNTRSNEMRGRKEGIEMKVRRHITDTAATACCDTINALEMSNEMTAKDATKRAQLEAVIDVINDQVTNIEHTIATRSKGSGTSSGGGNKPNNKPDDNGSDDNGSDDNNGDSGENTDDGHQEAPEPNPGGGNNNNGGSDKPPNPESPD